MRAAHLLLAFVFGLFSLPSHAGEYQATQLEAARYSCIKAIALAAITSGKTVRAYSHRNSCGSAGELGLYN